MSTPDYNAVREDIKKIIPKKDWDKGSLGPIFVRLAWHASGTYDKHSNTGGSDGATMRFPPESTDGANNGLKQAQEFLEPIKSKYPWISYADLWTLAGVVAVEALGGPVVPWKPGRKDKTADSDIPPNGRLPDAEKGEKHIREVFNRMGFNDREIVALLGAHCLGQCHRDRSGYEGPWTFKPTTFTAQFYTLLLNKEWTPKEITTNGVKKQQYRDDKDNLMMLPSDMAIRFDPEFKKIAEEYSKDKQLFFNDFAAAFGKLLELGVKRSSGEARL